LSSQFQSTKSSTTALTVAAVGIVYGDIGTSPLYTMQTIFSAEYGLDLTPANILGVVSLIMWGLFIVVALKYVSLILRADNRGEGGIIALMALALESVGKQSKWSFILLVLGLFGAALFYGDGVITPAMSVISAIEGLNVATPNFSNKVVPITVIVLIALYSFQYKGTTGIGNWFGPIMILWFVALSAMGIINIIKAPVILAALNPIHAINFLFVHGWLAFVALGAVVLAFTGAEALYADMGHFGRKPIRLAWFGIVFPALMLNYLGQGGLLLTDSSAAENPFYHQLGAWSIYPLVALSTIAAVIASQATISGTYSMTKEAISVGLLPRLSIIHTSVKEIGQIYMPMVNWIQLIVVLGAVVGFGSSANLAAAYGIAVTATMLITTILTFFVIRYSWKYNLLLCIFSTGFFFVIDAAFFSANALKIFHGGWFPLVLGGFMFTIMLTWHKGRGLIFKNLRMHAIPLKDFLESLFITPPPRVGGTAIFLRSASEGVPHALLHNLSHNKILHDRVVFLTVYNQEIPWVPYDERVRVVELGNECYQLDVFYGFKNEPDIPQALELAAAKGLKFEIMETSFFVTRQTIVSRPQHEMSAWREWLFVLMSRTARDAADYYHIPSNRVIEVGSQVEI
jgi:KUP system potassium uptake protein